MAVGKSIAIFLISVFMCKKNNIFFGISNNCFWLLILVISIAIIAVEYYFKRNEDMTVINIFANIAYSLLAATIFYLMIDVVPTYRKNQIIKKRINRQFIRIKEEIRLCKSVLRPFDLDKYNSLSRDEYIVEFKKLNLNTKYISKNGISIKEYLIRQQGQLELLLNQLLEYNQHLDNKELKVINDILDSAFLMNSIIPIDYDVPDQELHTYPNNQREIGESIYDISELIKQI